VLCISLQLSMTQLEADDMTHTKSVPLMKPVPMYGCGGAKRRWPMGG
jgi:hypothetical protein